nr:tombus P33-like protein [Tolivirales sp.]
MCDGGAQPWVTADPATKAWTVCGLDLHHLCQVRLPIFHLTMATTHENPLRPIGLNTPRLSTWNRLKLSVKRWYYDVLCESEVMQLLCCVDATEADNYVRSETVRQEIREAMRTQMGYNGQSTCVAAVMHETQVEHGYALGRDQEEERHTAKEWDAIFEARSLAVTMDPTHIRVLLKREPTPARIVPRFAAAVTLHIKAKLGVLSRTPANLMLVQRKYLEVCRDHGVRDVDTTSHLQFVLNTYFTEDVLDRLAKTRLRAPAWLRMFEEKERAAELEVC